MAKRKANPPRPKLAAKKSVQQVIAEDLSPDDAAEGYSQGGVAAGASASLALPKTHIWARPVTDERTKEVTWQEYELRPYLRSVEDLWHRLCEADVPLPFGDMMKNLDAFASCAVKLLYLLSHETWQYRQIRGDTARFLEVIEQWADECVPRTRTIDAVTLVLRIHNQAHNKDATDTERAGDSSAQG